MPACLCCFSVSLTPRIAATNSISSLSLQTWDSACHSIPVKFLIVTTSNTRFIGPTRVLNPSGISIASAVFAGLTSVTDRPTTNIPTDEQTYLQTHHVTRSSLCRSMDGGSRTVPNSLDSALTSCSAPAAVF